MQFLCLFSFVVVASYAAALPQPAELSGKYSSNVNSDLASGLEARSYQPVVDTLTDSVTLMSLKRRDNSGESPRTSSRETFKGGDSLSKGGGSLSKGGGSLSKGGDSLSKGGDKSSEEDDDDSEEDDESSEESDESSEEDDESSEEGNESSEEDDESSEEGDESSEEDDESGTSPSTDTTSKKETEESETHLEKAERGTLALTSTINGVGEGLDVPRNVKAVGNAIDGNLKNLAVEYLTRALFVSDTLKNWANNSGRYAILVVYETFGRTDYAKTVGFLRDTTRELTKEVRGLFKEINDYLKDIKRKYGNLSEQLRNMHVLFGRVYGSYIEYFKTLQTQLAKVRGSENICKYLSNAYESVMQFVGNQTDIFGEIKQEFAADI
ncbi:hypothetical protein BASA50_004509 [Batrachochytrium salamandrivorans]|uniref:Uncharacterized protein n=1 Tax=Batrachochytrium salamandrivorans TaxID=1357716 RepID=A0ABQ8FFE5_9FUNG|nr:hypothetical protein BASA50_004509 [Batrachochytrium salamandrivorans]KAH9266212.1 hypothetical protein BASA84_001256 [Batrachochytrium salamandrivorans]